MNLSKADTNYRFYLCVEQNTQFNHYECVQVPESKAIKGGVETPRSIVVPINKHFPKVLDFMFINNALKPSFYVQKS
jgi:hypothetical protein